jgi:plastocyanin
MIPRATALEQGGRMVLPRVLPAAFAALALIACGSSGGTEPTPTNNNNPPGGGGPTGVSVTVANSDYSPDRVTVARGTTVTWRWDSCYGDPYGGQQCTAHSVTFDDGGPSAPPQGEGSFSRTFGTAGTFTYYCSAHGRAAMSGSVVVQ